MTGDSAEYEGRDLHDGPDTIEHRTEKIHYSELHTALEQYRGEDLPGSIVGCRYPSEDASKGYVEITFAEVTSDG